MRLSALTLAYGVMFTLALALVALLTLRAIPAYDLYWQLKTGEVIVSTHHVPKADIFSYTAFGDPWYVQEWLSEVLFIGLWKTLGKETMIYLRMIMITAAFGLVLWRGLRRSGRPLVSVGMTLLAAWGSAYFFDSRPQMMTYLGLAGLLLILDEYRAGRWTKAIWLVPPMLLVWSNLHAGFFLGLALLWVYTLADLVEWAANREVPAERLLVQVTVTLLATVAPLVNPNGWHAFTYPFLLQGHEAMRNTIGEWFSPDFHRSELKPFGALLLTGIASLAFSVRRRALGDILVVLGLISMSLDDLRRAPGRRGPLGRDLGGRPVEGGDRGFPGAARGVWTALALGGGERDGARPLQPGDGQSQRTAQGKLVRCLHPGR